MAWETLRAYIDRVYGSCDNDRQNVPYSLYVAPPNFMQKCESESDNDVRHLGRHLTYGYTCKNCGPQKVHFSPDYPYAGPNSHWTCEHCYSVMKLDSVVPLSGNTKKCSLLSVARNVVGL